MSAYKNFLSSDIIVSPLELNKSFKFSGSQFIEPEISIDRFIGKNVSNKIINSSSPTTGNISTQYQGLIYKSIQELYYSNYLSSSYGSPVNIYNILLGSDSEGDTLIGTSDSSGRYENYNQSTLTFSKYFPTSSNSIIGVVSIPSKLYGNHILPNSFTLITNENSIHDDGEGNLINTNTDKICGQIFYPHGLAVITNSSITNESLYGQGIYGQDLYGNTDEIFINNLILSNNITCSFSSSITIYETQYKCTVRENEFNFSLNPSLLNNSNEDIKDYISKSYFKPYVTTVGLYNDNNQLLATAKLAQPLPLSPITDTSILINIDR